MRMKTRLGDRSEKDNDEEEDEKDDYEEDEEENDDNEENQGKCFEVGKEEILEGWEGRYVMGLGRRKSKEVEWKEGRMDNLLRGTLALH